MSTMYETKQAMKDALIGAGLTVKSGGDRIGESVVVIEPGNPYLEPGDNFGELRLNINVVCIGPSVTSAKAEEGLDTLIAEVLLALGDWNVESVSLPGDLPYGTAIYFAATVTFSAYFNIKEVI